MVVEEALRSFALCLAVVFSVAAVHKVRMVRGAGATHPLLGDRSWSDRTRARVLAAATLAEGLLVIALIAVPAYGLLAAVVLLAGYTLELRRLRPDEGCNCFGELLNSADRAGAIRRNCVLAALALIGGAVAVFSSVDVAPLTEVNAGAALLVLSAVLAAALVPRQTVPTGSD